MNMTNNPASDVTKLGLQEISSGIVNRQKIY